MSRTKKLTLSALIAAMCVASLFLSALMPRVTLAMAALAGIFPAAAIILAGNAWAAGAVITAAVLGFLLLPGDKTAVFWFILFFGHYPFWKLPAEALQTRRKKPAVGWAIKLAGFVICMVMLYLLFRSAFAGALPVVFSGVPAFIAVLAVLCVCFIFYDIAFSILIGFFRIHLLPRFR